MSDSNEMNTNPKHPRLRLPQAGIKAQEAHDNGEPLTSKSFIEGMHEVWLDALNARRDPAETQAIVAVANVMVKTTALELKYKELQYRYAREAEMGVASSPLIIVSGKKNGKPRR